MEGASTVGVSGSRRGGTDVEFLRGDGAVVADLSGGYPEGFLAEHVALCQELRISGWGFFRLLLGRGGNDLQQRCWPRQGY